MTPPNPKIRLYVPEPYASGKILALPQNQSHYLANVMRAQPGDPIAIFNGLDGQWLAEISSVQKKQVLLEAKHRLQPQASSPDLWLCFAPIKNKTDLVVEKATELGVSKLIPTITQYTVVRSANLEKLTLHAIEAAEQCERHDVPAIETAQDLPHMLGNWPKDRTLLYGDESGKGTPLKPLLSTLSPGKYALLIGPEGGFSPEEHRLLASLPFVKPFTLGPRILRADTAAVAALACIQSHLGDWHLIPSPFQGEG